MAIASMICGIIGLLGSIISVIGISHSRRMLGQFGNDTISRLILEDRLIVFYIILVVSIISVILAFVFGIITRKKGKDTKYYGMANAGFIMGLIGIIIPLLYVIIVTGLVITYLNLPKKEKSQTVAPDPSLPYEGRKPLFSWYTDIGTVTTRTKDSDKNFMVTVVVNIGYDTTDTTAYSELSGKKYELQDFLCKYFAGKYAEELKPENEERIKQEIKETLNKRYLENARVRDITFTKFDVIEVLE
jgi:flagellar FliL protein